MGSREPFFPENTRLFLYEVGIIGSNQAYKDDNLLFDWSGDEMYYGRNTWTYNAIITMQQFYKIKKLKFHKPNASQAPLIVGVRWPAPFLLPYSVYDKRDRQKHHGCCASSCHSHVSLRALGRFHHVVEAYELATRVPDAEGPAILNNNKSNCHLPLFQCLYSFNQKKIWFYHFSSSPSQGWVIGFWSQHINELY